MVLASKADPTLEAASGVPAHPHPLHLFDLDSTKAQSDKKSYRLIRLANGLRCLLVRDPPSEVEGGSDGEDGSEMDTSEDEESEADEDEDEDGEGADREGPRQSKAAAAMAVGVGSFSDPANCHGLAHFVEHMLFMGSKKYPDENHYEAAVQRGGGGTNAMTETEYTVYHFDVLPEHLHECLDVFAQFFIEPLFNQDSSDRELQSIESEFRLSKQSDGCRLEELWCHSSKDNHPYSKFCWGDLRSLKEQPAAAGLDIKEEMLAFHKDMYKAENMQLVVLGTEALDDLEAMVTESFSGVPGGMPSDAGKLKLSFETAGEPFPADKLGHVFRILPVSDIHKLVVTWQLPPQLSRYRSKACDYLGDLIGHEGKGSLLSLLKSKGWATGIRAGVGSSGFDNSTAAALFNITFSLTKSGVRAWEQVVLRLFRLLAMVIREGPQEWFFNELRDIAAITYRFQEEQEPEDLVEVLAVQMLPLCCYEPHHLLSGPYVMEEWAPQEITDILSQMTPERIRVDLQSSLFGRDSEAGEGEAEIAMEQPPQEEDRFGIKFWSNPVPSQVMQSWSQALAGGGACGNELELALPPRNPFIPSDFTLRDVRELKKEGDGPRAPLLIDVSALCGEGSLRAWHLQDTIFLQPRGEVYIKLSSPLAANTPYQAACCDLIVRLVNDIMTEYSYLASIAELGYSLRSTDSGFEVHCYGFSDKLAVLLGAVLEKLLGLGGILAEPVAEEVQRCFDMQLEGVCRAYENARMKPGKHATGCRLEVLLRKYWNSQQKLDSLKLSTSGMGMLVPTSNLLAVLLCQGMSLATLAKHVTEMLSAGMQVDSLVHGNFTAAEALEVVRDRIAKVSVRLIATPCGSSATGVTWPEACSAGSAPLVKTHATHEVLTIAPQQHLVYCTPSIDSQQENSALEIYWQVGPDDIVTRSILSLLEFWMEEPLYDQLRTREQLGYSVGCGFTVTDNCLGFRIKAQSASHAPSHLYSRVIAFLTSFADRLRDMTDSEIETGKTSLSKTKLQKDNNLGEESSRHWDEITKQRYCFHCHRHEAAGVLLVSKEQLCQAYQDWLKPGSSSLGQLTIMVTGAAKVNADEELRKFRQLPSAGQLEELADPQELRKAGAFTAYQPLSV
ncbi:unnamed protein product [Chrysoparadoxa australica]